MWCTEKAKKKRKSSGFLHKYKIGACFRQITVVFCPISRNGASGPGNTGDAAKVIIAGSIARS
jgi:hypothetical protein